ncbi:MAG: outer membrane beta-barrel protein [Betaproteobacteria bacterium]|nr:outer membrane beta-barrel protein [Betaproteobacteria bacterium]
MKKNLLVAALLSVAATGTMAQSAFDGAYGQVGIGYASASPSGSNGSQTISTAPLVGTYSRSTSFSSTADFTGVVTVGYMGTVSKNFLMGIGAEYSPIAGSNTNATTTGGGLTSATSQYKVENSYNIFLSPAIAIDKDKLLYGKVGYAGTSVKTTYAGSNNPTLNFTGYSLGVGYKQIISGGLYGFAEGNYFSYGNQSYNSSGTVSGLAYTTTQTVNTNAFNLLAGIGYKF